MKIMQIVSSKLAMLCNKYYAKFSILVDKDGPDIFVYSAETQSTCKTVHIITSLPSLVLALAE